MLICKRKKEEAIIIDGLVRVVILETQGRIVKLGIDAPKQVSVHREEIYKKISSIEK